MNTNVDKKLLVGFQRCADDFIFNNTNIINQNKLEEHLRFKLESYLTLNVVDPENYQINITCVNQTWGHFQVKLVKTEANKKVEEITIPVNKSDFSLSDLEITANGVHIKTEQNYTPLHFILDSYEFKQNDFRTAFFEKHRLSLYRLLDNEFLTQTEHNNGIRKLYLKLAEYLKELNP